MSQSFTNLLYHIIFSTKERRPIITTDHQPRLYEYIGGVVRGTGGISLGINGMEDHVHLLAKLRPDRALSDVLRELKSNATGWMHDVFPRSFGFLMATWLCSIHRQPIKPERGATLHRESKRASSEGVIQG
mgnify:CR=1 FL=1